MKCYLDNSKLNALGFWGSFSFFVLCEFYTAACSHRAAAECRRDPRRPPPLERHRATSRARVILGSFFQHTLQSPGMKTLQTPLIIYCSALLPWLWWSFSCCITWISLQFKHIIVSLTPRRGEEQLFPFSLWKPSFCMRIVTTSPLLLPSSLSTNQLQFFWETFQPIQINMVLQCMWLHTTGKNPIFFSSSDFDCQSQVLSLCLKHLFYCVPVWVITSDLIHDAFTLSFLLQLVSVRTAEGEGFLWQLIFLHLCLTR